MKYAIYIIVMMGLMIAACNNNSGNGHVAAKGNVVNADDSSRIGGELKSFYIYYISKRFDSMASDEQIKDTLDKYCTAAFLSKIRNDSELESDPFTHTQDIDEDWRKTLKVTPVGVSDNKIYTVGFFDNFDKKMYNVKVTLKKSDEHWKIEDIGDLQ